MYHAVQDSLLIREGESGEESEVEGSSKRPGCQGFCFVTSGDEEFRGSVEAGTSKLRVGVRVEPGSCTKVDQLAGLGPDVHQHVLRFNITMNYPSVVVEVPDCFQDLLHDLSRLRL